LIKLEKISKKILHKIIKNIIIENVKNLQIFLLGGMSVKDKITVLMADDNPEFAKTLTSFIEKEEEMEVIGLARDGNEAFDMIINTQPDVVEENTPQLSDCSDTKAEAIGRSMLFRGVDDVNNDLKALLENPQIAENSDELFESAYKVAQKEGVENPYEEAATASTVAM